MKVNIFYKWWVVGKYNFYKAYWKIFPPKQKVMGFYGWHEECCSVLDQQAVGYGVVDVDSGMLNESR